MYCQYCQKFEDSKLWEESRNGKGKIIYQTRYCPVKDDMIKGDDKSCYNFIFVPIFWCAKYDQRRYVTSCLHRIKKKFENCSKCKQGQIITKIYYAQNKPTLMKRRT